MGTPWKGDSKSFAPLNKNAEYDAVVIGGGIAGLWCAYKLVRAGRSVCVLDADRVGGGVTAGSTAILTYAQDVIYSPLIRKHGEATAAKFLHDGITAMNEIKDTIEREKFLCDFEKIDFVLFSTKLCGKWALNREYRAYQRLGHGGAEILRAKPNLPYNVKCALKFNGCFQLNPRKLCAELGRYITAHGGEIFEKTMVREPPDKNKLTVGGHTITAKDFVVATHFPFINLPGFYFLKVYQSQNYSMLFAPPTDWTDFCRGVSYESIDKTGFEYRRAGEHILCDGARVRTGGKPYRSKYRIIEGHIKKHFGGFAEVSRSMAQDCITLDKLPYAGRYSHFMDNVFVVTGFNKWGMTAAWTCAAVITDMITGKLPRGAGGLENIYSPQRVALGVNLIETVYNTAEIAGAFANNLLNLDAKKLERIRPGQGAIIKHRGHRVGASRDNNGKLNLISGICPHMGCSLKWNKDERSFDCPCHGSRFDCRGNILSNPATKNAERLGGG